MTGLNIKLWIDTTKEESFIDELEELCNKFSESEENYYFSFK